MKYTCGIVGGGRQGAGNPQPYTTDLARKPWTHKEAYEAHPECSLEWIHDSDKAKVVHSPFRPHARIVSICTEAKFHLESLYEVFEYTRPLAIFMEKPLASSVDECMEIISKCNDENVILAVNHQRAWEMPGVVHYGGDKLETGSHAAEIANRLGMELVHSPNGIKHLSIHLFDQGPMVSLLAITDIIRCIETPSKSPRCSGEDGLRAVERALSA